MVATTFAAPPPTPPFALVPLAEEPPPPPPMRVTWVEMTPAGTSKLEALYQPLEHCPVVPLIVAV